MKRARVIVFEGTDGVGKTTQVQRLSQALWAAGMKTATIKFPIRGTITGDVIYGMLDSGTAARFPSLFQAVQIVDKFVPQVLCIPYLLVSNDFIVIDRWNDSCRVYGAAAGVASWLMKISSQLLFKPDVVLLLDGNGHRVRAKIDGDAYERDSAFQARVRASYLEIAAVNPETHAVIYANAPIEAVHNRIWSHLIDKGVV